MAQLAWRFLIAQWSKLDKMTVSKSLKTLVLEGLVYRMEHQKDTRAKSVSLTKKGIDLIYKLVPIVKQIDAQFFGRVPEGDQRSLIRILNQ